MPQSLDVAAFVFGAILILLSLVVGSFKLFGAEVQGTVGRLGRVVAFVLGLILIVSRLVHEAPDPPKPGTTTEATTTPAPPGKAAVEADLIAPTTAPPAAEPEATGDTADVAPARELLLGTWRSQLDMPDGKITDETRYERNGTYSGIETVVSKDGLTNQNEIRGTWRIRQLSPTRFTLTTHDKELRDPESYTYRVLDHERLQNEDLGGVVRRVPGK